MATEITTIDNSPSKLMEIAINQNADVEKLEKLMAMQERLHGLCTSYSEVASMTKQQLLALLREA